MFNMNEWTKVYDINLFVHIVKQFLDTVLTLPDFQLSILFINLSAIFR